MEPIYEFSLVTAVANVGISLLTEQNAVSHCQLMEYSTCVVEVIKTSIVIATLKGTATRCHEGMSVLESGSEIVMVLATQMPTVVGIQFLVL